MRNKLILISLILIQILPSSLHADSGEGWRIKRVGKCLLHYMAEDLPNVSSYEALVLQGIKSVESFWGESFSEEFDLYIHPRRSSMDQAWQSSWNMPDFQSECWMVASGVAHRMDLLSPAIWHKEACEHSFEDLEHTQKLITHELFHVFHGQHNPSPDFSEIDGIDWFVEGLATYASGQLDENRKREVSEAAMAGKSPATLDSFWKGQLRYGFCASMLEFLDHQYGRPMLRDLLALSTRKAILDALQTTESTLLTQWQAELPSQGL